MRRLPSFLSKLTAFEAQAGRPFDEADRDLQDAIVLRRLQQMTNTLRLNPLWRERLAKAGVTEAPATFEDWYRVPISDKEVCRDFFMDSRPGLVVGLEHGGMEIVASGGTSSGRPVETVYSLRELHDTYRIAGDFMGRHVLSDLFPGGEPRWMITTLADYQMWSSGTMVGGVLQSIPGFNYIGAGPIAPEVYRHILSYPGRKAFMGITQGIAILAEFAEGLPEEIRRTLRVAMYGSGLLSRASQAALQAVYPEVAILSYFAATQAETIGLQRDPDSPWLTAIPGLHLVEIVDQRGYPVAEGEEGELVVTRLHAHEAPIPRYRIGDRMIRRPDASSPTLRAGQFEFAGRSGDVIHLADTQFSASRAYALLRKELKRASDIDLDDCARSIQFVNHRTRQTLDLVLAVEEPETLARELARRLGAEGARPIFMACLAQSLSLFNAGEANDEYLAHIGYSFAFRPVSLSSDVLYRTPLGKVPLIRDLS